MQTIKNRFYIQTDPAGDVWTEITDDVLLRGTYWSKGILGAHPTDRVASPGRLNLILRNDGERNKTEYRYTPGRTNCTVGFGVKTKIMIKSEWGNVEKIQFIGYIPPGGIIQPSSPHKKQVQVIAYDWFYFAINNIVTIAEIQSDKTFGEHGLYMAGLLEAQPSRIDNTSYAETFVNINDTVRENTTVYREITKAALSEMGYAFITYERNSESKDILVFQGRTARERTELINHFVDIKENCPGWISEQGERITMDQIYAPYPNDQILFDTGITIDGVPEILEFDVRHGAHFANRVTGKTYPRKVADTSEVIFELNHPIILEPGETRENLRVRYVPIDGYVGISATDVSVTGKQMNTESDASGNDLSKDLIVTGEFGSGDATLTLENRGEEIGYVTILRISGKPIYIADTVSQVVEVETEDAALFGKIELILDQKYIVDPIKTYSQISLIAARYSQRENEIESFVICPNKTAATAVIFMSLDIGSRINLKYPPAEIDEDYIIQGSETWSSNQITYWKVYVKRAKYDAYEFWKLGVSGYSELNQSAILGLDT